MNGPEDCKMGLDPRDQPEPHFPSEEDMDAFFDEMERRTGLEPVETEEFTEGWQAGHKVRQFAQSLGIHPEE